MSTAKTVLERMGGQGTKNGKGQETFTIRCPVCGGRSMSYGAGSSAYYQKKVGTGWYPRRRVCANNHRFWTVEMVAEYAGKMLVPVGNSDETCSRCALHKNLLVSLTEQIKKWL